MIVELDVFTKEDFKNVLINKLLPLYPNLYGVPVDDIVAKAHESELGIRSLTRQLEILSIEMEASV